LGIVEWWIFEDLLLFSNRAREVNKLVGYRCIPYWALGCGGLEKEYGVSPIES
jgi:hypothetical protein